jgi:arylsulfatase A
MFQLTLAAVLVAASTASADPPRPNIVLVMTDDQGYWDTGVSGNEKIDTPVMDRLAAEGVWLKRYYAAPVCSPTRAGMMTGRCYIRTGLYNTRFGGDSLDLDEITLAELLKQAGYRTGIFGKWHLGRYAGYRPNDRGFDEFLGHYHGHIERYDYPDQLVHNGRPVEARGYVTDLFTDAAIEFIRASGKRPFFCYLPYNAPHSPYVVGTSHDGQPRGDALIEKYLARDLPLREARIYAMVDLIDQNLGRLLGAIDELDLRDNTIVIFTSDNGGVSKAFKAGLKGNKASVWEGGIREPFFARWPGHFPAGATVDAMTSHVDLLPTFCELLGIPLPDGRKLDGRSILPLLVEGKGESPHKYLYHTWDRYTPNPHNRWAISSDRYKLVGNHNPDAPLPPEPAGSLYDLLADPGETKNIAAEHPEIVRELRAEFLRWFADATEGHTYEPVPIPVGSADDNPVEIQASWARLDGDTIQYTFRGYDWDTIDGWSKLGEAASWRLDVLRGGRYEVTVSYGCGSIVPDARSVRDNLPAGGALRISAGESAVECRPRGTPTPDVFTTDTIGALELAPGPAVLKAEVAETAGGELMQLNRVWLKRLDAGEPARAAEELEDVTPLLAPIREVYNVPALAAVALTSERLLGQGAVGVRRRGSPELLTIGDKFHIGSCTKAMTATLSAMLVEDGKLSWNTTIADVFPDLVESMKPAFRSVTLEQLLSHRGGTPGALPVVVRLPIRFFPGKPSEARDLLLRAIVAQEPAAEPGTKFLYSNAGYAIAGHMAETVAGKDWETLVGERIAAPLGMTSLGFGAPGTIDVVDQPRGHVATGAPIEPSVLADNPAAIGPAGTVHCTLGDWAKFVAAHLAGAQGKPTPLGLKRSTFEKLHTPAKGDASEYALGWGVAKRDWADGVALTHFGSNTLWFVAVWIAPRRDFAVLSACNQGGDEACKACDAAASTLIRHFLIAPRP